MVRSSLAVRFVAVAAVAAASVTTARSGGVDEAAGSSATVSTTPCARPCADLAAKVSGNVTCAVEDYDYAWGAARGPNQTRGFLRAP